MQHFSHRLSFVRIGAIGSMLLMSVFLSACQKSDESEQAPIEKDNRIALIQQDLVEFKDGVSNQRTAFSGTIRAVNQSSIQAQVTATAAQVNAQVGQNVQKGQVLVVLNNQDNAARLAQTRANLASASAQAQQASNMVQRKQRLYDKGFISKVELEQSQLDYKAQLETVRAQQANVEIAQKADQDGVIRSPISGVITKRQVEPGQTVAAGQTLFEIVDPTQLELQAKLPIEQQNMLKIGRDIEFTIQGSTEKLAAKLTRISPIADQASRQIEFYAKPTQAIQSLSIGGFVDGYILDARSVNGQVIPLEVIQDIDSKPYVWIVRQQKIQQAFIQILEQQPNNNIAIVNGLQPNDLLSRIKFSSDEINKSVKISAK